MSTSCTNGNGSTSNGELKRPFESPSPEIAVSSPTPSPVPSTAPATPTPATYANQHQLKRLPLPPLQPTLQKFLHEAAAPLLTPHEFELTKQAVDLFAEKEAPRLYSLLEAKAKEENSYIERFWDSAYLDYDAAIPINVNPVFILEDDPTPSRSQLLPRAVSLVFSSLKFARAVRTGALLPDKVKDTPLCMDQFRSLFGSARVPNPNPAEGTADVIVTSQTSTHICVICENQFYYFRCLYPGTYDLAVTERELTKIFTQIIHDATSSTDHQQRVGLLTTETRGKWRECRRQIAKVSDNNRRVLDKIDSALFVVCLDVNYEAQSVSDACANILHGDPLVGKTCANRWYDKLQLIVTKGGTAGVNFEHSAVDGHSVLRYASDVFIDTVIRFAQTIQLGGIHSPLDHHLNNQQGQQPQARPDCKPRKLEFDLPASVLKQIHYAESRLADAIFQNHTITMEFTGYGKTFLVQNQLSPDATAQLAMQTAFFALYGEPANTYESVLTKAYFHGRTEAGRSCTPQAVEFMRKYYGEEEGEDGDGEAATRESVRLLRVAAKQHSKMTGEASKAMGVDRLLYALECVAGEDEAGEAKPAFFSSPGYVKLGQSVLSTSNCGNPSLRFFGFGPVCAQGFGIGYIIKDESMHFMITSKRRQTERYRDTLQQVLERIHDDLLIVAPKLDVARERPLMFRQQVPSTTNLMDLVNGEAEAAAAAVAVLPAVPEDMYDFFGLVGREI